MQKHLKYMVEATYECCAFSTYKYKHLCKARRMLKKLTKMNGIWIVKIYKYKKNQYILKKKWSSRG